MFAIVSKICILLNDLTIVVKNGIDQDTGFTQTAESVLLEKKAWGGTMVFRPSLISIRILDLVMKTV